MKTYHVNVHYDAVMSVDVQANSEEEAIELAEAKACDMPMENMCFHEGQSCVTSVEETEIDQKTEIKEILAENDNYIDIRELGLCLGFDEVIEYVTLNIKKDGSEILIETEYGDFVSFDTLAKYQQDAIYKFVKDYKAE